MTNAVATQRWPWEPVPVEETVALLQRDFGYAVMWSAIVVHSTREELRRVVNTRRGQIMPRGECRFSDGTTVEFVDIGMPQPSVRELTVRELVDEVTTHAFQMGLTFS